ncbi:MAG: hypothetical protein OJJ21_00105 [Ferrovibrio sp.]|uniref:hypothetical protein n=1 Tax=Ferrovibrio sp. TaxID=1917215 RepID=UPI00262BBB94|nr:hypothetical protein [Ferrovibrio sp.]MCW0231982.1 hypothetical protein [Ferrovibrio sp.]
MPKAGYDPFKDDQIAAKDPGEPSPADAPRRRYTPLELEELGVQDYPRITNRRPGQRVNWANAAEQLARGHSVVTTASLCDCEPERIWRNLRRSRKFRARIDLVAERLRLQADLQFRNLNIHTVLQMRQRTGQLDTRTLHWLAEKLRLGQAPAEATTLADWLEAVAAVPGPKHGRRPRAATPAQPRDSTGSNGIEPDPAGSNGIELASNGIEPAANGIEPAAIRPGMLHPQTPPTCG